MAKNIRNLNAAFASTLCRHNVKSLGKDLGYMKTNYQMC